jgi:hypothetical protein
MPLQPVSVSPASPTVVTISIASPGVVTWANHGLWPGSAIMLFSTGTLPTGLSPLTLYYVISAGFTLGSFQIAAASGGAAINTSVSQSGVHSAAAILNGLPNAGENFNALAVTSLSGNAITNPTAVLTLPTRTVASPSMTPPAASPCVFTWTGHPLVNGMVVVLSGTTMPGTAQFVAGTPYYVVAKATNTFELAATAGGTAINATTTAGVAVVATINYIPGLLIANSTTPGSVASNAFAIATSGGGTIIPYLQVLTSAGSGWAGVQLSVNLWRAQATYTNGDGQTYAVATGAANYIATFTGTLTQFGDGAAGNLYPTSQVALPIKLASGTSIYWDVQMQGIAVPVSAQTFTITAGLLG